MNESAANPNGENKCPQCGAPLPSGGLAGLCPACMLKQAATETALPTGVISFQPPSVEELAKLFPQLEIISLIGRGGMGAVYKARQPLLDRIVALKILPAAVTRGTDFGDRFTREARALAKLNHPNIVMVHEFGQVNGQPYFLMEYVDGVNLRQLEREGKLTPREALQIVPQICEALQFAHDAGIVHRDIKPDNILLDKKGRVKIADFGIAKILGTAEDPSIPMTQGAIGTPHYMAPEQVEKPQTVDHRADIFSLGVVFYEMLTGELPLGKFSAPSAGPHGLRVDVRLDEVVFRALEREPNRRYQHASQVKTAVETIASTQAGAHLGAGGSQADPKTQELLARDYRLEIRHSLSRGWALVKSDFWPLFGITALILALIGVASGTFASLGPVMKGTTTSISILGLLLNGPLLAGLFLYFLKKIRREPATVETAFAGFSKRFLHLFLANFVVSALTALAFFCFILPGIYVLVAWVFTLTLVIDKGMDFWPAMELSRKVVHKHWWKVLLFLLVLAGLLLCGFICCLVGIFIAMPVAIAAFLYAYEDIFGTVPPPNPLRPTAPVNPAAAKPASPAAAAAFGPGGTMVMPGGASAGAPPPIGAAVPPAGTPPRAAKTSSGGSFWKWIWRLGIAFLLLLLLLIAVVALLPDFSFDVGDGKIVHTFGTANILWEDSDVKKTADGGWTMAALPMPSKAGENPAPAAAPQPPAAPAPPGGMETSADSALAKRTRSELQKISARFANLAVSASSPSNVLVTFTGLEQSSSGVIASENSAITVTNEDAVVSISMNGIQVNEKKHRNAGFLDGVKEGWKGTPATNGNEPEHAQISIGGFKINVNDDPTNDWQKIEGSLVGSKTADARWLFLGAGKLAALRFEMAEADLMDVLPPAVTAAGSQEIFMERLDAAKTVVEPALKDKLLRTLSADAARAGQVEVVKSALAEMIEMDGRDAATHDAALQLAGIGRRKEAIEMAKGIADPDIRDRAMTALANDPRLLQPARY